MKTEKATFAAGCFWGVQAEFDLLPGVKKTIVGYTGGKTKNPTYEQVCSHATGHAEAVEVEFDPKKISYAALVGCFFSMHDPTTRDRQGPDVGSQYRSAIFYHSKKQKEEAEKIIKGLSAAKKFPSQIVTEITEASAFYQAEDYHQKYLQKHKGAYCHI